MPEIINPCFGHNIIVVDTHYYRERCAASHLLVENGKAAFVDVGTTPANTHLLSALHEQNLKPEDVNFIILTHIHLDHAGGAGTLMQHCPNARLVVHPRGARHISNPEKLISATIEIYGTETFNRLYKEIIPVSRDRLIVVEDGDTIDFQGRKLHFFDTPGHAPHHCSIWDPASRGIFTGDTLGLAYPEMQIAGKPPFLIPITTPASFDPGELKRSIKRLAALEPDYFYITHYGPVQAVPRAVDSLLQLIDSHAEIGRGAEGRTIESIKSELLELYHQAYCSYSGESVPVHVLTDILAGDLELNAQGVAIWSSKMMKRGG